MLSAGLAILIFAANNQSNQESPRKDKTASQKLPEIEIKDQPEDLTKEPKLILENIDKMSPGYTIIPRSVSYTHLTLPTTPYV